MSRELSELFAKTYQDKVVNYTLDNVQKVADYLCITTLDSCVISVAGTNGKGSTCASLQAMLLAHGKSVACFTSPHIFDFYERFALNGKSITAEEFSNLLKIVTSATKKLTIDLSFFETITCVFLLLAKTNNVDYTIIEAGLGGRLDATNVVNNDIVCLTSIGYDHCEILGESLDKIATEKLGLLNQNSKLIYAPKIEYVALNQFLLPKNIIKLTDLDVIKTEKNFSLVYDNGAYNNLPKPSFPSENFITAMLALLKSGLKLNHNIVKHVLQTLTVPGRFTNYLVDDIKVIIDGAHNPCAINTLVDKINNNEKVIAISTMRLAKNIEGVCAAAAKMNIDSWIVTKVSDDNKEAITRCQKQLDKLHIDHLSCASIEYAIDCAIKLAKKNNISTVVLFGSMYSIGPAILHMERSWKA